MFESTTLKSQLATLRNEENCDLSIHQNEYAEALKRLKLATKQLISLTGAPSECVKKDNFFNSEATQLIESDIKHLTTIFDDMAEEIANHTMFPEVGTTQLLLSEQADLPEKLATVGEKILKDVEKKHDPILSTEVKDDVTQTNETQSSNTMHNATRKEGLDDKVDQSKTAATHALAHKKRKADSIAVSGSSNSLGKEHKKNRLTEKQDHTPKQATPVDSKSCTSCSTCKVNSTALLVPSSIGPTSTPTNNIKPVNDIHQSVSKPSTSTVPNTSTAMPSPSKCRDVVPTIISLRTTPTKAKDANSTNVIRPPAPKLTDAEYAKKTNSCFIPFLFNGQALKDDNDEGLLAVDAYKVHLSLECFEGGFVVAHLDKNLYWHRQFEICVSKMPESNPLLIAWFEKYIKPTLSWEQARSIIELNLGAFSPKAVNAIKSQIHSIHTKDEHFQDYCKRFFPAAGAALFLIKEGLADPSFSTESKLIDCFISGARNIRDTLSNLRILYTTEKWQDFKDLMDEFEEKIWLEEGGKRVEEMMAERKAEEQQSKEESERRENEEQQSIEAKRRENKERSKEVNRRQHMKHITRKIREQIKGMSQLGSEDEKVRAGLLLQINRNTELLMNIRKKQGLCTFCGKVKHSVEHLQVCKGKKKYSQSRGVLL